MTCNDHFRFEFADAVVIRENVGNVGIGNVTTLDPEETASVSSRLSDGVILLDFGIPKGKDGGGSIEITKLPMTDALSGNEVGTWYIYHDTKNDTYDLYGYANVDCAITPTSDFTTSYIVYNATFPFCTPSGYSSLLLRKHHATVSGDVSLDKGGFYISYFTISTAPSMGYIVPRYNGVGTADDGCKATGTVKVHVHIEAE